MKKMFALALVLALALCFAALAESEAQPVLEDGVYTAEFTTDHSMFHVNEVYNNLGTLSVKD